MTPKFFGLFLVCIGCVLWGFMSSKVYMLTPVTDYGSVPITYKVNSSWKISVLSSEIPVVFNVLAGSQVFNAIIEWVFVSVVDDKASWYFSMVENENDPVNRHPIFSGAGGELNPMVVGRMTRVCFRSCTRPLPAESISPEEDSLAVLKKLSQQINRSINGIHS